MAYRFLLEVPEAFADEANVTVGSVEGAQVVLIRNSHSQGFDDPYLDLTIAAHTLGVVQAIYEWFGELAIPKPPIAVVLHSGQRILLTEIGHGQMVARIRRDQPWVERTLPKIGDHERDILASSGQTATDEYPPPIRTMSHPDQVLGLTPTRRVKLLNRVQIAVNVTELERAERYYVNFLGMNVLARERENAKGDLEPVEPDYDGAVALAKGTEADVSFLGNRGVTMALDRVGRGARLERSAFDPVPIDVDRNSFLQLKADAFMRGMEIIGDSPDAFIVRDIYGLAWQFTVAVDVPSLVPGIPC